jgi:hypothetical protein
MFTIDTKIKESAHQSNFSQIAPPPPKKNKKKKKKKK